MILVFDVGNTETTIGLFDAAELRSHWRLTTTTTRTPDEICLLLLDLLRSIDVEVSAIAGTAIGSVVPGVTPKLVDACAKLFGAPPLVIDGRSKLPIKLQVD